VPLKIDFFFESLFLCGFWLDRQSLYPTWRELCAFTQLLPSLRLQTAKKITKTLEEKSALELRTLQTCNAGGGLRVSKMFFSAKQWPIFL